MPLKIAIVVALCLILGSACAAAVYVDSGASGKVHNGTSWATAYQTITQALDSLPDGGDIWVKTGVYHECLTMKPYTNLYGGFLGFETSTDQRYPGAFPTVISGWKMGRVIDIPVNGRAYIDGFTIRDGKSDKGAGIHCSTNSITTIINCRIENCEATGGGGGVFFDTYTQGQLNNCVIACNKAPQGGGLVVEYHSYPTMHNDVIINNYATSVGGGVYCPFHSGAWLENCTIAYNTADTSGGGIYAYYGGPETFIKCIIAFNSAPMGGGIYGGGGSTQATLSGCDWFSNVGGNMGGAITSLPAEAGNVFVDPMFLMPGCDEFHLSTSSQCGGIGAYPIDSAYAVDRIGVAKLLPDSNSVKLSNKIVSCVDGDITYVQEADRSTAIPVRGLTGCSTGKIITSLTGTLSTSRQTRTLTAASFTLSSATIYKPKPLGTRLQWLRSLTGVRTLTWGKVDSVSPTGFTLRDGDYTLDVRLANPGVGVGNYISVVGSCVLDGSFVGESVSSLNR